MPESSMRSPPAAATRLDAAITMRSTCRRASRPISVRMASACCVLDGQQNFKKLSSVPTSRRAMRVRCSQAILPVCSGPKPAPSAACTHKRTEKLYPLTGPLLSKKRSLPQGRLSSSSSDSSWAMRSALAASAARAACSWPRTSPSSFRTWSRSSCSPSVTASRLTPPLSFSSSLSAASLVACALSAAARALLRSRLSSWTSALSCLRTASSAALLRSSALSRRVRS
mmetsp:Transcript_22348/g.69818  ORF Transcript_22348/g.69818 Transcript_22348/m.69818 type:complete len:227 (+) Transcript_22348:6362-7042(+)